MNDVAHDDSAQRGSNPDVAVLRSRNIASSLGLHGKDIFLKRPLNRGRMSASCSASLLASQLWQNS